MSDKAQTTTQDAHRSSHAVAISVGVVATVLALYVLSVPFAGDYGIKWGIQPDTLQTIYAPLVWFYNSNEIFKQFMDWYMKMYDPAYHAP